MICSVRQTSPRLTLDVWVRTFKKFGGTVENMADITDVVAATGDYTAKTREAATALGTMKEAYIGAANSIQHFTRLLMVPNNSTSR